MAPTNKPAKSKGGASPNRPDSAVDPAQFAGLLEESRQYLATIFATVHDGILVIDAETHNIVDANPRAVELIGCSREKIIGVTCHNFVCPADTGNCPITDLGQTVDSSKRTLLKANGEVIPITKTVASITLRGRLHLVEIFLDISGWERTEESLKESEERCRDLFENANDLIQSVDPKGHFLYVNRAWKETMGYTDKDIARLRIFDIIAPTSQDHCLTIFQRVMSGEKIQRVDVQFVAKDGRIVDIVV